MTKNVNIPNALSISRIIFLPLLYYFALNWLKLEFLISYIFIGITDALDGFLARLLNQVTKLGKILDTVADIFFYFSTLFFLYYFYPEIISFNENLIYIFLLVFLLAYVISIIKFKKPIQIHTNHLRFNAVLVYLIMIFSYFFDTRFFATIILLSFIIGFIEEIIIFIKFDNFTADTRSVWELIKKRKK